MDAAADAASLAATISHADAKAAELERRAAFIESKRAAARERAAHISDIVSRDFAQRLSSSEARVGAQVAEAHAKADSIDEKRRLLQRNAQLAIAADRQAVIARRAAEKAEADAARAAAAAELRGKVAELEREAAAAESAARDRARQLAAFHLAQVSRTDARTQPAYLQISAYGVTLLQMADKKRMFEGAHAAVRSQAADSAATAAGDVADAYTAAIAAAAKGAVQAEEAKGRATVTMERTLGRQRVVAPVERR